MLSALLLSVMLAVTAMAQATDGKMPVTTSSDEARALYLQARDLQEKFRFVESKPLLERAIALDPNFAVAYRDLAFAQTNQPDYQKLMDKAVALGDRVSECEKYAILAPDAAGKANIAKQREYLGTLAAKCPNDERVHTNFGVYYFGRQFYDSAAAEFQRAVDIEPKFSPAWNMLGYSKKLLGDLPGAEQVYLKYIEVIPGEANPYDSYAELLLKMGRFEESVTRYKQALSVDTTFVLSRFGMAAPLVYLGRYDEARREMQELLERAANDGQRATAHFGTAMTYADEGKLDDCIAALRENATLSEAVNDVAALSGNAATIGFIRLEQGRFDDAATEYNRAWTLVKDSDLAPTIKSFADRNLIYCQARIASAKGEHAQAEALADEFMASAKGEGGLDDVKLAHELCGIVALAAGQNEKAITELLQANVQTGYNKYRLALAYHAKGDMQKAVEYISAAAHINNLLALNDVLKRQAALQLEKEWAGK